jgi:hypothetical protein
MTRKIVQGRLCEIAPTVVLPLLEEPGRNP